MIGKMISHYKIIEKIGQGGMGEVYLADDTTLDRKVALKFLPEAFTNDPERMARFEREAKLLASLNHTNIAGIYGLEQADGNRFLVLEYVEGETLQARLRKGALPLEEALSLCRQIAEGLEAAHEKGVIHRDLKPANVMITAEEKVKILDFGLAKALSDETQSIDSSQSPTLTEAMTQPGVILGTAAYMSPEQAKGKSVDKRTDIWAFGCILYECLTGKKAFEGETVTETLAAILRGEPNWQALPGSTPYGIRFVLRRCLEKDMEQRFRDAADIGIELDEIRSSSEKRLSIKSSRTMWIWAAISIFLAILVVFLFFHRQEASETRYFHLSLPTTMPGNYDLSISPDGQWIAFVAFSSESSSSLFVCEIGSVTPKQIDGTEGAAYPFWSPDGKSIGFFAEGRLNRVDRSGGPPRDICMAKNFGGGTWNSEEHILFNNRVNLYLVSAEGGDAVLSGASDYPQAGHVCPHFLPDGRHYLFTTQVNPPSQNGIYVGSLDSNENKFLLKGTSVAAYANPGYLFYQREGSLFARPFDAKNFEFTGEAALVAENVLTDNDSVGAAFGVSQNGVLVYRAAEGQFQTQFVWLDRNGKQLDSVGDVSTYMPDFDLSPDEKKVAVRKREAITHNHDIWMMDLDRGVLSRLTKDPTIDALPFWSPDGREIVFASWRNGKNDLFRMKADGIGAEEILLDSPENQYRGDWSENGKYVVYSELTNTGSNISALPLSGEKKPFPLVQSSARVLNPALSNDGNWLAYQSNESGIFEVYITSFPNKGRQYPISKGGGTWPQWRADGREFYYITLEGALMAVDINAGKEITAGIPHELFNRNIQLDLHSKPYHPTSDGNRILFLKPLKKLDNVPITVVLNWTSLLKQ